MNTKINELLNREAEISAKMTALEGRELNEQEAATYRSLDAEYKQCIRERQLAMATASAKAMPRETKSLIAQLRESMQTREPIHVQTYTTGAGTEADPTVTHAGVGDHVVETEIQGILDPLYANSALAALGVRWFKGMPMGDIRIPSMGKGSVAWAAENGAASQSNPTFTSVLLQPKRLTAYVDISKQLIEQDTMGAEEAIRRDIAAGIIDKLENTIFGTAAGSTTQPAGLFNGATIKNGSTFAGLVAAEGDLEADNVTGKLTYLMSPSAKADLRGMAKNGNGSGMVFENGEVDGVPAVITSNVPAHRYIYGNWQNLAVAQFGTIDITTDPYSQAINGCVRLIVNAYFDAKECRTVGLIKGKTQA